MHPDKCAAPLFGVNLELVEPDIVFTPSLDFESTDHKTFLNVFNSLLRDIVTMAELVPRVSKKQNSSDYKVR